MLDIQALTFFYDIDPFSFLEKDCFDIKLACCLRVNAGRGACLLPYILQLLPWRSLSVELRMYHEEEEKNKQKLETLKAANEDFYVIKKQVCDLLIDEHSA